jgi:hypothetical protein
VRLLVWGHKVEQERADALEACPRQAQQARQAREVAERLRFRLDRLTVVLQEAGRKGCKCDPEAGRACRLHELVKDVLDGDGEAA